MLVLGLLCLIGQRLAAQYALQLLDSNTFKVENGVELSKTSFRGLSVVNDSIIWVSGNRGTIAKSVDEGKTFHVFQIQEYPKSDFRDIEAFSEHDAIMISSGTPAYVLKTCDGGNSWEEVFKSLDTAIFLDGMDFWNKTRGVIIGDPVKEHFFILHTIDGGENWKQVNKYVAPKAMSGEAIFAASGTSIRCWGKSEFGFVTGGSSASFYQFVSPYEKAKRTGLNIQQGKSSKGAFSLVRHNKSFFAVGGDYLNDSVTYKNFEEIGTNLMYEDVGSMPIGYLSCIEKINNSLFIACGTRGVNLFDYNKKKWEVLNEKSYHVVKKSKLGTTVFLAGSKGKIAKLVVK